MVKTFLLPLLVFLSSAYAGSSPISFTGALGGEQRTVTLEGLELSGRLYIPLAALGEAFGGQVQVTAERAQIEVDGKTASIQVGGQRVNTATSQFSLGHPLLVSQGQAWLAPDDVVALFTNAFGLPVRRVQAAAAPEAPTLIEVEPLLPLEPLMPLVPQTAAPESETSESPAPLPDVVPLGEPLGQLPPRESPAASPEVLPQAVLSARTIVLDPGHGGTDPGVTGGSGLSENQLALALAELLRQRLVNEGFTVVMTRTEEHQDLALKRRVELANEQGGDLLISIHAGSSPSSRPHGVSIFYPYGPGGPGAPAVGRTRTLLGDPIQNTAGESKVLAESLGRSLRESGAVEVGMVRQAPLRLAAGLNMPCVLLEAGYLTNNTEEGMLRTASHQAQLVEAIVGGMMRVYQRPSGGGAGQ